MPSDTLIQAHRAVQSAAKSALADLATQISPVDTEESIAATAYRELCRLGFPDTWYYNCPAFVLAGSRSCESISGRAYIAGREPIGAHNLVTVDLSPVHNGHWGDCARSFYVEDGRVTSTPASPELANGQRFLKALHADMQQTVHPDMTFRELFEWTNQCIAADGFENLDFLGNVCRDWEGATEPAKQAGIRVVNLRIGVVLTPRGGALAKMLTPFKLCAGGIVGSGRQYWSWIALDDVVGAIHHAITHEELSGPVNAVSPESLTNAEFTKILGRVLRRPTIAPLPAFVVKLLLGEMGEELLLASTRVAPNRLKESGYQFRCPTLEVALRHLLGR